MSSICFYIFILLIIIAILTIIYLMIRMRKTALIKMLIIVTLVMGTTHGQNSSPKTEDDIISEVYIRPPVFPEALLKITDIINNNTYNNKADELYLISELEKLLNSNSSNTLNNNYIIYY